MQRKKLTIRSKEDRAAEIRKILVEAGVKNLKEYGYPNISPETILTDYVFAAFFRSMLEDNIPKMYPDAQDVAHALVDELKAVKFSEDDNK